MVGVMVGFGEELERLLGQDPAMLRAPYHLYARARQESPVFWSSSLGAYLVSRYEDVVAVAKDPVTFSNRDSAVPKHAREADAAAINELTDGMSEFDVARDQYPFVDLPQVLSDADGPAHGQHRKMVLRVLSARRVGAMVPIVQATCDALIEAIADRGECDLIAEVTRPLPSRVILRAFGIPESDSPNVSKWIDGIGVALGKPNPTRQEQLERLRAHRDFHAYFSAMLDDRRRNPTGDLISEIANSEAAGVPLTEAERMSMILQLISAGHETTTRLIASVVLKVLTDAALNDRLRAEPDLLGTVIEETLRLESPVQGIFRLTTRDARLGDVDIPADSVVWILWASANRDEKAFPDPCRLDVERPDPKAHLAFGHGPHFCPGAQLGLLETRIAVATILRRLPNLNLAVPPEEVPYLQSIVMHGPLRLPVRF